ncbi:MAG TPA: fumarylacetoacetate hydrolase family protein [Gemmatimonadales bacterium]|nr:fumarylacetoacetate hydrolase family protein [Gemmatimonadales bacterium]
MIPLRPGKIIGVGRNYAAHARELGNEAPEEPILFLKPPSALLEPGGTIRLPGVSRQVEHEAEIGVVVGRRLRSASVDEAERAVGGITCVNDVTCRDLQRSDVQWTRAKGFDTFCPVGPRVATDVDWRALEVRCRVNGQERQLGRAADMQFSIPFLLSYISGIMTLEPGDLIATGTPAGVGPLRDGDVVEVEIPGVGILSNPVRNA